MSFSGKIASCEICHSGGMTIFFHYSVPPATEVRFPFVDYSKYNRDVYRCGLCGHFQSSHDVDLSALYSGEYVSSNYRDIAGIAATFKKISSLPPGKSDNAGRVRRIVEFCQEAFPGGTNLGVLDVGSGLGVFPYAMKKEGWNVVALDPDQTAARHLKESLQLSAVHGDFLKAEINGSFQLITFNKVLEHVENPFSFLERAKGLLNQEGILYIELPDGEMACHVGSDREEFTIDHLRVFSFSSLALLLQKAGLEILLQERLVEPSGKFTLRAFAKKAARSNAS